MAVLGLPAKIEQPSTIHSEKKSRGVLVWMKILFFDVLNEVKPRRKDRTFEITPLRQRQPWETSLTLRKKWDNHHHASKEREKGRGSRLTWNLHLRYGRCAQTTPISFPFTTHPPLSRELALETRWNSPALHPRDRVRSVDNGLVR